MHSFKNAFCCVSPIFELIWTNQTFSFPENHPHQPPSNSSLLPFAFHLSQVVIRGFHVTELMTLPWEQVDWLFPRKLASLASEFPILGPGRSPSTFGEVSPALWE